MFRILVIEKAKDESMRTERRFLCAIKLNWSFSRLFNRFHVGLRNIKGRFCMKEFDDLKNV